MDVFVICFLGTENIVCRIELKDFSCGYRFLYGKLCSYFAKSHVGNRLIEGVAFLK